MGYKGQAGYYTDAETGLILCTWRYYDPSAGRWLTEDPIGYAGGLNVYAYCGGSPALSVDALGLCEGSIWSRAGAWYMGGMGGFSDWVDQKLFFGQTAGLGDAWGRWDTGQGSGWEVLGRGTLWLGTAAVYATAGVLAGGAVLQVGTGYSLSIALYCYVSTYVAAPLAAAGAYGFAALASRVGVPAATFAASVLRTTLLIFTGIGGGGSSAGGGGRSGNDLRFDRSAQGAHTTFRYDGTGRISNYATWERTPPGAGQPFYQTVRADMVGEPHGGVPTPHTHVLGGKVRPTAPDETPRGW